jgi:hypothetical protein
VVQFYHIQKATGDDIVSEKRKYMVRTEQINQDYFGFTADSRENAKQEAVQQWRATVYSCVLDVEEMDKS